VINHSIHWTFGTVMPGEALRITGLCPGAILMDIAAGIADGHFHPGCGPGGKFAQKIEIDQFRPNGAYCITFKPMTSGSPPTYGTPVNILSGTSEMKGAVTESGRSPAAFFQ
jgi:hypothetical protein